jgi:hypothetical protein
VVKAQPAASATPAAHHQHAEKKLVIVPIVLVLALAYIVGYSIMRMRDTASQIDATNAKTESATRSSVSSEQPKN